ncbi:MAG: hypothetical protein HY698_13625 [Deltaproteobacteria bacterium]|nr:hypothetical protein [Deltaproteobacteria bacterium]
MCASQRRLWPRPLQDRPTRQQAGGRLSDHKPVLANLKLIPMQQPPKFHPNWHHDVAVRVVSANASNQSDCWSCGEVDLYPVLQRHEEGPGGTSHDQWEADYCDDSDAVSVADSCTSGWVVNMHHDPARHSLQGGGADLYDDDDTSGDDHFSTVWLGEADRLSINWASQRLELRDFATGTAAPCVDGKMVSIPGPPYVTVECTLWWKDTGIVDNAPLGRCTRFEPPFVCLELSLSEIPPPL